MPALTQITVDADGTIGANMTTDAGSSPPDYFSHCEDAPDGGSSDWVGNDTTETSTTAWFSLENVDADFDAMTALNIDVDLDAVDDGSSNDTCALTAQIFDADNDQTNALTDSQQIGDETDGTRVQRNLVFGSLTGTKAQWDTAHLLLTWTYVKPGSPDNVQVRLYGLDIDGTYDVAASGSPPCAVNSFRQRR